jgi:hypothetical protein
MNITDIKKKLQSLQASNTRGSGEKIDYQKIFWKPGQGKHVARIVPYKNDPDNPFQEVYFFYGIGDKTLMSLVNFGEKDPIVEFSNKLKQSNDKDNYAMGKKLEPKMRIFAHVLVRGEEEKGVRLWEFGKEVYMELLSICADEDYGNVTDIKKGRDIVIEITGEKTSRKTTVRAKPKETILTDDAEELKQYLNEQYEVIKLRKKHTFDELKQILTDWLTPPTEGTEQPATQDTYPPFDVDKKTDFDDEDEPDTPVKAAVEQVKKSTLNIKKAATVTESDPLSEFDDLFNEKK